MYGQAERHSSLASGGAGGGGFGSDEPGRCRIVGLLKGKPAIYHCVSRVVGREFVFKREEREQFVGLMRRYENFAQVKI